MRNSFELALDHIGRKMGGLPVEVIYEDDEQKPEVGKQKTEKLIESDKVDFIVGYIWSNVLLASLKPVRRLKTFLITANAGPSQIAGELCSPYVFSTSWQNDQTPQAMGHYMNQKGVKTAFLIGPNYAAGKDMLAGVASTFKGKVVGRGTDQVARPARLLGRARRRRKRGEAGCDLRVLSGRGGRAVPDPVRAGRPQGSDPALHRVHHRRTVAAAAEGSRARRSGCAGMGQRPAERGEQEVRCRLHSKVHRQCVRRSTARRPMTPPSLIALGGCRDQGQSDRQGTRCAKRMEKADFKSVRGRLQIRQQPHPDPELLSAGAW